MDIDENKHVVVLVSSDNQRIIVNRKEVNLQSITLSNMLDDNDDDSPNIPIPITSFTLQAVVDYIETPSLPTNLPVNEFIPLLRAANYLNMKMLLDRLLTMEAKKIAHQPISSIELHYGFDDKYYKDVEPNWHSEENLKRLGNQYIKKS